MYNINQLTHLRLVIIWLEWSRFLSKLIWYVKKYSTWKIPIHNSTDATLCNPQHSRPKFQNQLPTTDRTINDPSTYCLTASYLVRVSALRVNAMSSRCMWNGCVAGWCMYKLVDLLCASREHSGPPVSWPACILEDDDDVLSWGNVRPPLLSFDSSTGTLQLH